MWFGVPCILSLMPSDFHLFGPINKHLADSQFAREADIKQAFISWLHILDISFFCATVKALVLQWDTCINIPMGLCGGLMCTIFCPCTAPCTVPWIHLSHTWEHLCVSPLIFISKERLFANVTAVNISLYHKLGVVGFLWNSSNQVLHYIVPETRTVQSAFSVLHNVKFYIPVSCTFCLQYLHSRDIRKGVLE